MTYPELAVAAVAILALGIALVPRFIRHGPDYGDNEPRQIDIIKRGEICPWPRAD